MNDVLLRRWRKQDAQQLSAIANNRKIWLNLRDRFPHPYTVMDALQWVQLHHAEDPAQNFCIEYQGKVAGGIGILTKEDVYRRSIEIGYFVGEPYWGKGIASYAVSQMMAYIEDNFEVNRVYAEVFEHNLGSMRVLRKNGFHLEGIRHQAVLKDGRLLDDYIWVKFINKQR